MSEVIDITYVEEKLRDILPIDEFEDYVSKLNIFVPAAISKLQTEGVDINAKDKAGNYIFNKDENCLPSYDYVLCVSYQVTKDMDSDVDMDYMTEQYVTRVGTLRCKVMELQH